MKIEYKIINKEKGILRVTTTDERWYMNKDGTFKPSVTWICSYYPKGIGFMKWLAQHGWSEAEAIKADRGTSGSKIHAGVSLLLSGQTIRHDAKIMNQDTGKEEELTTEEYGGIMSFRDWFAENKPETIAFDENVFTADYAGTLDYRCRINGEKWIIDFKSSQDIWPSHEIQVSAYKHTGYEDHKTAILQLGYRRNKKKFKFTEIPDKYELFLAAKQIWENETAGVQPLQKDFPLELSL